MYHNGVELSDNQASLGALEIITGDVVWAKEIEVTDRSTSPEHVRPSGAPERQGFLGSVLGGEEIIVTGTDMSREVNGLSSQQDGNEALDGPPELRNKGEL